MRKVLFLGLFLLNSFQTKASDLRDRVIVVAGTTAEVFGVRKLMEKEKIGHIAFMPAKIFEKGLCFLAIGVGCYGLGSEIRSSLSK